MKIVIPMLGLERNGGNRVLTAIINRLAEAGHQCEIFVPGGQHQPGFALAGTVHIRQVSPAFPFKPLRWVFFVLACTRRLRHQNILANHFLTALAARLAGITSRTRIVYLVQDIEYRFYRWPLSWLTALLCRYTYGIDHIVPANPWLEAELDRLGVEAHPGLQLGVARAFLAHEPAEAAGKTCDVAFFLRRGRHKRLDRYAAIAHQLKQRGISMTAIAPEPDLFETIADSVDYRIVPKDDTDIINALDRCRVLLLASEQEGFSLPPLEAMARGLPVVMFPCGGPENYACRDYNALVIDDERTDTAADTIEALLADTDRYRALSANARDTARRFSLDEAAAVAAGRIIRLLENPEAR